MTIWKITLGADILEGNLGLPHQCLTKWLRIEHAVSYLPTFTYSQIDKKVDSKIRQGVSPRLEFSAEESSDVSNDNTARVVNSAAGYYDNRYRTPCKLPMLHWIDPSQVLYEVADCCRTYPDCYICPAAFDSA